MDLIRRGTGAVHDFVDVVRQIQVDDILAEAERHFEIVIAGPPGCGKTALIRRLMPGTFGGLLDPFGLRRLVELRTPLTASALETAYQADLVIGLTDATQPHDDGAFELLRGRSAAYLSVVNKVDLLAAPAHWDEPAGVGLSALTGEGVEDRLVPAVLDALPECTLALGRAFSSFRPAVVEREIRRVARVNAEVAVVSAIPQASLILGPASAVADMLVLTKNQAIMLLRLAAVYGLPLDRGRVTELLPVAGAAFAWRSLARELVGFLPAGFGVVPKAVIAYAGTVAEGRAAAWYYQTGRRMPETQFRRIYDESAARARGLAREIGQRLKRAG